MPSNCDDETKNKLDKVMEIYSEYANLFPSVHELSFFAQGMQEKAHFATSDFLTIYTKNQIVECLAQRGGVARTLSYVYLLANDWNNLPKIDAACPCFQEMA